jgi:hypothetical protein
MIVISVTREAPHDHATDTAEDVTATFQPAQPESRRNRACLGDIAHE